LRPLRYLVVLLLLVSAALAADLNLKVVDPDSRPVANARVTLYRAGSTTPLLSRASNSEGVAAFGRLPAGAYRAEVLAPGFARQSVDVGVPSEAAPVAHLHVAGRAETVVVAANRTPVPAEESGAQVETLSAGELRNLQPLTATDALRYLPGAILNTAGQRGGLGGLFVEGGESRFNQVFVDGVPVKEPGGAFNFSTLSMTDVDRLEFVRGAQSTLYGADAMTSVILVSSAQGSTRTPELRFGADGGSFGTAHGYGSFSGVAGRLDYNLYGDQLFTDGRGANDTFSLSTAGANVGVALSPTAMFRLRARHQNSRSGVQGEWVFGGQALLPPDLDAYARDNATLASAELVVAAPGAWRHRFLAFESNDRRFNADNVPDRGCALTYFDCPFFSRNHNNRAGFSYQGEYQPRSFATTTFGYDFEGQNGQIDENFSGAAAQAHGNRLNHSFFVQQLVTWRRLSLTGGARFVHDGSFGNRVVPRVSATLLALRGNDFFTGTRLRFSFAQGINAPTFDEQFGLGGYGIIPNPALKPEQNRNFEAGVMQEIARGRLSLSADYFNNLFRDLITYQPLPGFQAQYINLNRSMAHGADVELHARPIDRVRIDAAYVYTSSQVLEAPYAFDPLYAAGAPLLRRPRHAGSLLVNYLGKRWGAELGGNFVGRRADSDFLYGVFPQVPTITHAAGYALVNAGGWVALNRHMTAYLNIDNLLDRRYEEVVGYPALPIGVRVGMRFRVGGD
jgi:vitamin B12 transporter